jgi:hypothetical protein
MLDDPRVTINCWVIEVFPHFDSLLTENDFKSNKTTGVFAPVSERTAARTPLASAVEPRILPEAPVRATKISH